MITWTSRLPAAIGDTDELRVSSRRADGGLPPSVPVRVVAVDVAYHLKYGRCGALTVALAIALTVRDLTTEVVPM